MSYFEKHVFICTNKRDDGSMCCDQSQLGSEMFQYAKARIKEANLDGPGKIRINKAGCLGRCAEGPVMVVYPEETWYTFIDQEDVDDIIEQHLIHNQIVERLKI